MKKNQIYLSQNIHKYLQIYMTEIILCFAIIICIFAVYIPCIQFGFVHFDDQLYVFDNPHIRDGLTWDGIKWAFTTIRGGNWHPLTWISHMLDISCYGMNAGRHHWNSIQIHILSTILLFIFLRMATKTIWISASITAIFALHPIHVESVAWVAERKDVLSVCMAHMSLVLYIYYIKNKSLYRKLAVLFCFCLSLLSKPMMVTLPFLFLLLDFWPLERFKNENLRSLLSEKIIFIIPVIAIIGMALLTQNNQGAITSYKNLSIQYRILNAGIAYILYIKKMIIPFGLSVFYPHPATSLSFVQGVLAWIGIFTTVGISFFLKNRFPFLFTGTAWYFGTLIPVIGIVQIGRQQMADRYTYFPMTGFVIVLLFFLVYLIPNSIKKNSKVKISGFIALVLILSSLSMKQVKLWENDFTLFSHALKHTSNNYIAHVALGYHFGLNEDYEKAVKHYQESISIKPDFADAHINLGNLMARVYKKYDIAEKHYLKALQTNKQDPVILNNLGNIELAKNNSDLALKWYILSLTANRTYKPALINIARLIIKEDIKKSDKFLNTLIKKIIKLDHSKSLFTEIERILMANNYNDHAKLLKTFKSED